MSLTKLLFNPFSQAPLSYLDPFFQQLFIDVENRAKRIDELVFSFKNIQNPLRLSISGGRGYGKTTLLNAVARNILVRLKNPSSGIKLMPVYSKISGIAYVREPDKLRESVYSQVLIDLYTLVNTSQSDFRNRLQRYARSWFFPDVAKSAISVTLSLINPFLAVVAPIARKIIDDTLKHYHVQSVEDLMTKPSINTLNILESIAHECNKKEIKPVFIIDELDKAVLDVLVRFFRSERRFFESYNRIIVVALSTGIGDIMSYARERPTDLQRIFDTPSPILLTPITTLEDAEKIVYARIRWASGYKDFDPKEIFPLPVLDRVLDLSDGIPASLMDLCARTIQNASNENAARVEVKHLPYYAEEFRVVMEYFSSLPSTEKTLIKKALQKRLFASDKDLQRELNVSRSRLTQILRKFKEDGLMISQTRGRKKLYVLTEETKANIEGILRFKPEIFQYSS
jgi:DNA-binding MarR family transcriptional regulator